MASDICAPRGPAESPQRARNLHSGQLASLDKLCVGRKGAVKKHCCFSVPKSPGPLHFQSGCPYTRGCTSSNPEPRPAELTRSARLSEGTRSQRRRLPARRVAAMQRWQGLPEEAPLGGQYLSLGRKGRCRLGRPRRRPAPSEVGSEGSVGSTGVAPARDPGRAGAQAAHRRPGLCSPRPAGGAASPLGVPLKAAARRCATPRGALFAHTGILAAAAPLADCSLSLLLPLARPPAGSLQSPGLPGGVGGVVSFGVARACSGPGASQGMHRPPQVAKSRGKNAPAPPPPAPSPGSGGRGSRRAVAAKAAAAGCRGSDAAPGASAPKNNWSRWSREDARTARRTVYRACELTRRSRDGASRALTRPWPRTASKGSRGLSLAPPGARRHLA